MNIREKIVEYLSERYGWTREEIKDAESFEALGLDSLSLYSLVADCEEKFGIKVETNDITEIDTPEKFINYLSRK